MTVSSESLSEALDGLPVLGSSRELFTAVEEVVRGYLGRDRFSIVGSQKGRFRLVYSNAWAARDHRLSSPEIDLEEVETAARTTTPHLTGPVGPPSSMRIEGKTLPVRRVWRLGNRDGDDAHIVFHDEPEDGAWGCSDQHVTMVARGLTAAYYQFFETQRLHEETDLLRAKLEAINEIGKFLGSLDLEVLLTKLMELSLYVVQGQVGSIILARDGKQSYESPIEWGLTLEMASFFRNPEGRALYEVVIESGEAIAAQSFSPDGEFRIVDAGVHV
ncbi:MAG: hypothetical protein KDC38_20070, partial [Planctomycetes bacterium]|nr:hypothetical protein [Planctomycetota bacterium]